MKNLLKLLFITLLLVSFIQIGGEALLMPVSNTLKVEANESKKDIVLKAAHVVPDRNQYAALQREFIAFIHFGPNTFTRMEWGNGMEDPKIFNLKNLDTDQWCRSMKAAGMKLVILTVKHHDGFVLWQSRYTKHGIMSSPYKNGKGDILKELSESCKKYGLKLGIYLSPADLYQIESEQGLYGNRSKYTERVIPTPVANRPFANKTTFKFVVDDYNAYFLNQLFELLTEYGPVDEVWFDGAHPKRKGGQKYNYQAWKKLIRTLAPNAVIFGKEDIRWCGNESGATRKTEWNVIPYQEDPDKMNHFPDMTAKDIGSREQLYKAKYLHYQPAETNTSIREGWFYRDDTDQKVRSADDVFDIYERAVGGNSIFLLNIPPNRQGKFSDRDEAVLREVGQRIRETYGVNLLDGATTPRAILDDDPETLLILKNPKREVIITTPQPVTVNRFMIQEAVSTHGERVEAHALDVWIDNGWKEVAAATNIGYKRILRFPDVMTSRFRLRIKEARYIPVLAKVGAFYYKSHPPELQIQRDRNGFVQIRPKKHHFRWKPHGQNAAKNLNSGMQIYYTVDGSDPGTRSKRYDKSFFIPEGTVKAVAVLNKNRGPVTGKTFGTPKKQWKLVKVDSESKKHKAAYAFDGFENTYWQSNESNNPVHFIGIDLGEKQTINTFSYLPQKVNSGGMIERGVIQISADGKKWKDIDYFVFGNLINDPTERSHKLKRPVETRFIGIKTEVIAGNGKTAAIAELDFY